MARVVYWAGRCDGAGGLYEEEPIAPQSPSQQVHHGRPLSGCFCRRCGEILRRSRVRCKHFLAPDEHQMFEVGFILPIVNERTPGGAL
jgi:hypothetical protein